ncbi:MAG: hypothetical protein FJ395_04395 [Verrucomicrobia bacterium]|nr:hypothetical protein [Verrucomicrobiota bacterium]
MNPHDPDNPIQHLFSEQRAADQQRAPSFQRTWQAAMTRAEQPARMPWLLPIAAGACAALIAAAGVFWWPHAEKPQPMLPSTAVAFLSEWTAPTDFLLEPLTSSMSSGTQP